MLLEPTKQDKKSSWKADQIVPNITGFLREHLFEKRDVTY